MHLSRSLLDLNVLDTFTEGGCLLVYLFLLVPLVVPVATIPIEKIFSYMNIANYHLYICNHLGYQWANDDLILYIERDNF